MKTLYETDAIKLAHEFEAAFVVDKLTGDILLKDDFYGDPQCGLIDEHNNWAIIAGEHLTIWTPNRWQRIQDNQFKWIHSMRLKLHNSIEALTDPWGSHPAIWLINVETFGFRKLRDFYDYQGKEYSDQVKW